MQFFETLRYVKVSPALRFSITLLSTSSGSSGMPLSFTCYKLAMVHFSNTNSVPISRVYSLSLSYPDTALHTSRKGIKQHKYILYPRSVEGRPIEINTFQIAWTWGLDQVNALFIFRLTLSTYWHKSQARMNLLMSRFLNLQ